MRTRSRSLRDVAGVHRPETSGARRRGHPGAWSVAAAVAASAALGWPAAGQAAASTRDCGEIVSEGWYPYDITVRGDTCRAARRLADKVSKTTDAPWRGCMTLDVENDRARMEQPCVKYRYRCRVLRRGSEEVRFECRRGTRVVRWTTRGA